MKPLPTDHKDLRNLSTKVGRTMGRIQWQAILALGESDIANQSRGLRLAEAWARLNTAWHTITLTAELSALL